MTNILSQALIDEFVEKSYTHFGKVRQLLLKYPDIIDARSTWGETAVEAATHAGQGEIINFLLSAGANRHECTGACRSKIERLTPDLEPPSIPSTP